MSLKGIRKSDGTAEYIYADDTLSEENAPGEAKAAGDRIAGVEGRVTTLETAAPEIISNATKAWLDDNVTPTGSAVAIDSSLTQSGLAADAKAAGDAVTDLKSDLSSAFTFGAKNKIEIQDTSAQTIDGLTYYFKDGNLHLNGTLSVGTDYEPLNIKFTNGISAQRVFNDSTAWKAETIDLFESGKTYFAYSELISGKQSNTGAVLSFRNSSGQSVVSKTKSPYTADGTTIAYGKFYIPCGVEFSNAVFALVLTETSEKVPYSEVGAISLNEQVKIESVDELEEKAEKIESYFDSDVGANKKNIISLDDCDPITKDGLTVSVVDGCIVLNGTTLPSRTYRFKITNGYDLVLGDIPTSWKSEGVSLFENGKTYFAYSECISGTETGTGSIVSFRGSGGQSVISETRSPVVLSDGISFGMFYIERGVTYNNAVYKVVCTETGNKIPISSLRDAVLVGEVEVNPHSIDELYYTIPAALTATNIHNDSLNEYGAVQGMCSDGENLYYSVISHNDSDNTLLKKYNIASNSVVLSVQDKSYGHANGMAYYPKDNTIYICHMDTTGTISVIDADTLEFIRTFSLNEVLSSVVPWYIGVGAVAFDNTKNKFVFLLRGEAESDGKTRKGFAIFDASMRFEKVIKTEYIESDTYSGLATDERFIYLSISNPTTTDRGEHIIIYDWHGNVVGDISDIQVPHLEAQVVLGSNFYMAGNASYNGASIYKGIPKTFNEVFKLDVLEQYNLNY